MPFRVPHPQMSLLKQQPLAFRPQNTPPTPLPGLSISLHPTPSKATALGLSCTPVPCAYTISALVGSCDCFFCPSA